MAEISKQALKVDNNQSFPNNNNGAITPSILRAFNVNMIDSMVDEIGYNADSASWNVSISNINAFTSSLQTAFVSTASFNAFTSSINAYTASNNTKWNNVEVATASLFTSVDNLNQFTASQVGAFTELNAWSASAKVSISALNQASSSLQSFTQSANVSITNLNTTTQSLNTSVSNINTFTASAAVSITNLNTNSASLNTSVSNINQFTASAGISINALNVSSASQQVSIDSLNSKTGSYATTGSNTFTGPNTFTSISASSFISASEFVGNGSKITGITASISMPILDEGIPQGNAFSLNFTGSGIGATVVGGTAVISVYAPDSASFNALTASYNSFTASTNADLDAIHQATASLQQFTQSFSTSSLVSTSSFNAYTASNDQRVTSLETNSASVNTSISNINSFTQSAAVSINALNVFTASQSTASLVTSIDNLNTFSASALVSISNLNSTTASLNTSASLALITASASGNTITFTKGNTSTFNVTVDTGSAERTIFEVVYTGENITKGDPLYISGSQGANPIVFKADAAIAAKMPVTFVANETIGVSNTTEAIVLGLIEGIDLTGYVAGQSIYVAEGGGWSASLPSGSNSVTQLLGVVTKGGNGGKGLVLNPGPAQLPGLDTGLMWVGGASNQAVEITTASFASSASFNSYTASNDQKVNSLIAATGSYATTGSNTFIGNQLIEGNVTISGSATSDLTVVGQIFVSSSATGGTTQPRIIVSGSSGQSTISRNSIITRNLTNQASLNPLAIFATVIATSDEIGFSVDPVAGGVAGWTTGPAIYVNNDAGDTYPAVFGFQNKANLTDGRVAVLTPLSASAGFTASLQNGYAWVGNSLGQNTQVATSSFIDNQVTSASFNSYTSSTDARLTNIETTTASLLIETSNLEAFTSSQSLLNTTFATTGSNNFVGNQSITGSLILSSSAAVELQVVGNAEFTGSVYGNVVSMSISANTASMDLSLGNYFELTSSATPVHISVTNLRGGLSTTLIVSASASSSILFSPNVAQPSGSAYSGSLGSIDVLSFVGFNSSKINVVATKALI
jgi:hypothetical protein